MTVPFVFVLRNNGVPVANLTPTFLQFRLVRTPFTALTPPAIQDLGYGQYVFLHDPVSTGEVAYVIDGGASISTAAERYVTGFAASDRALVQSAISANGQVAVASLADKTGFQLAGSGLDLVTVFPGVTLAKAMGYTVAAVSGICTGAGTGTMSFYAAGNGNAGILSFVATTPGNGNRTAITYY
jgi:hypothetical protein